MASRPSRSASIPIPRSSSSAHDIESLISIPFIPPPRSRPTYSHSFSQQPSTTFHNHNIDTVHSRDAANQFLPHSVVRTTARSTSPVITRNTGRAPASYEPRVIRAGTDAARSLDAACGPTHPTGSSQSRRMSGVGARGTSAQRQALANSESSLPHSLFPRPAYLEHSALREFLRSEPSPYPFPSRKPNSSTNKTQTHLQAISSDSDDEITALPGPARGSGADSSLSETLLDVPEFNLPTRWNDQDRHASLSVSQNGRELLYHGASCGGEKDASVARSNYSIPPACGIYYYEVDILNKEPKGQISIGFSGRNAKLSRLPGWEPNSWGYQAEDGCACAPEKGSVAFGPTYGTGDTVGCGIDFTTQKAFFTRNGTLIDTAFGYIGEGIELYPCVGLQYHDEVIRVNFGHESFKYDIDYHVQQQKNATWTKILETPLDTSFLARLHNCVRPTDKNTPKYSLPDEQSKMIINDLVMSYLVHHGYGTTAREFQKQQEEVVEERMFNDTKSEYDTDMEVISSNDTSELEVIGDERTGGIIDVRTKIVNSILSGDVDSALDDAQKYFPSVLTAENGIMKFKLRCRKFVELILETSAMKKKLEGGEDNSNLDWLDEDGMVVDFEENSSVSYNSSNDSVGKSGYSSESRMGDFSRRERRVRTGGASLQYELALSNAIAYGQTLTKDYKDDMRQEVRQIFQQTFGILAWENPLDAGGEAAVISGQGARVTLSNELNQAILKSQGLPTSPPLETLYRHTSTCLLQLGILGVGSAAFADMTKEFLET